MSTSFIVTPAGCAFVTDNDPPEEFPGHVQRASLDADIRALAIEQATHVIEWHCLKAAPYTHDIATLGEQNEWAYDDATECFRKIAQAVRVLDAFGLIASRAGSLVCIRKEAVHG